MDIEKLKETLAAFQQDVHNTALSKGWWDKPEWMKEVSETLKLKQYPHLQEAFDELCNFNKAEKISLMHAELSEALEALRAGNPPDDKVPQFGGVETELADTIIRILDFAAYYHLDVVSAMVAKAEMNKSRPYKHGGKRF